MTVPDIHPADPRFTNIQTDPRFRLPSKRNTHVQIDKRFAPVLEDDAFSSRAKVDRYGRKLPRGKGKQDLKKYYRIEDEKTVTGADARDQQQRGIDDDVVQGESRGFGNEDEVLDETEDSEADSTESSSEDDDEEYLSEGENDNFFGLPEEKDNNGDGIPKGEISSRLAVVNLDWDNIRATDLMAVFQSFVPASGQILKVAILPSDFGKERMEREELEGPPKEIFARKRKVIDASTDEIDDSNSEDPEDDKNIMELMLKDDIGSEFSSAQLRRYQLSRLRYYYAVLTCSSTSVASAIYDAVDGTEYLTTANFFDLRYIPDEMSFEDDTPRDECTKLPDGYRPNEFVTEALQHSKVKLTWDADDGVRKEVQKRAFGGSRKDVNENDLKAYLGSDSEDDDKIDVNAPKESAIVVDSAASSSIKNGASATSTPQEKATPISRKEAERLRMRTLLGLPADPTTRKPNPGKDAPAGNMQVTFTSGLSALSGAEGEKNRSVFENEPEREETTVEKYVRKEKERKARRKEKIKRHRTAGGEANIEDDQGGETTMMEGGLATAEREEEDLGFDDPFFTTVATANDAVASTPSQTKAARRQKRAEREAAESVAASERSKLENLLTDPTSKTAEDGENIKHFNINALARAEKVASKGKKRKKQKLSARDKEALEAKEQDDFRIDVADDRFRELYERADFAIDPSHPRFKGTEGMKRLLEEGRTKKKRRDGLGAEVDNVHDDDDDDDAGKKEKKRKREQVKESVDEVGALVEKVKKKTKASGT